MIKKTLFTTAIMCLLIFFPLQAQEFAPVGTAVAQFLEVGMGARGTGMGDAYTVLTDDAGSVFWNPAGIMGVQNMNFFMGYNRWPADISFGAMAYVMRLGNSQSLAISGVFINTDDMLITTVDDPEGASGLQFGITNYALGLTYGRNLTNRLAVGITTKLVREQYLDYGYTTWAVDVGTMYQTDFRGMKLGMSILHFGPEVRFSGGYTDYSDPDFSQDEKKDFEGYSMPINFRVGLSIDVWENASHKIISAADLVHPNNNLEQYNFGLEYGFKQMLFVRSGYRFQLDEGGLTLGAGARLPLFGDHLSALDYSFSEVGVLPSVHRLSVSFSF